MTLMSGLTVTRLERKVLERESRLALYYEVCDILFPSLRAGLPNKFSPTAYFPYDPIDKSLLSDILRSCNSQVIDEDNINRSES